MPRTLATISLGMILGLGLAAGAHANAPAPWWACEGLAEGAPCTDYGDDSGVCERVADCTDDNQTEVDECLRCRVLAGSGGGGCAGAAVPGALAGALLGLGAIAWLGRRARRAPRRL